MNISISVLYDIANTFISGSLYNDFWGYDLFFKQYYNFASTLS